MSTVKHFDPFAQTNMYDELKQKLGHSDELSGCVSTVMERLESSERDPATGLRKPICLLGKIQSGKTTGFIGVIAEAMSRGVKVVIVLTKNSTILGTQTTARVEHDVHSIASGLGVQVDYIKHINPEAKLGKAERANKRIIVGIKHHLNVARIYKLLVESNPELREEELLIIDDEADISSVGYRVSQERAPQAPAEEGAQPSFVETRSQEQLLVAAGINKLREALPNHYYLQVTATPASLFMQPESLEMSEYNADYSIAQIPKAPLLSGKTVLLPTHDRYIGGDFFFGEYDDPSSLAHFSHQAVSDDELQRLMKRDLRHIKHIYSSGNFPRLTHLVDNLLLCVAAQLGCLLHNSGGLARAKALDSEGWVSLLNSCKDHLEGFSAMVHVSTLKKLHSYHCELIEAYIGACKGAVSADFGGRREPLKQRLKALFEAEHLEAFKLFKARNDASESALASLDQLSFDDVFMCYGELLKSEHVKVYEINSRLTGLDHVDPATGELRRDVLANIFVGGQSLDRGITIARMVGFYYGRDPKIAQLDTTLQHARIYGARRPEDLVFTRLYMSSVVHDRLIEITEIDQILRDSIERNDGDNRFAAIELGKTGVRPTSPDRVMMSDCVTLRSYKRLLPIGFQTRQGMACERPMRLIDALIARQTARIPELKGAEEGFFITFKDFEELFKAFEEGMIPRDKWLKTRRSDDWELERLRAYYQILRKAYFKGDDRLMLIVKRGRSLTRLKQDAETPQNAPDTSKSDLKLMKSLMRRHQVPGVFLFEQAGDELISSEGVNVGWRGQRFYWPLMLLPELKRAVMISLDALNLGAQSSSGAA